MTRGVKVRLLAFVVLAAVGLTWVAGSYLGVVDRVLGRGLTVSADLPGSGGLFVGSAVTYRGVKVGTVTGMDVTGTGLRAELSLEEGTRIPLGSALKVQNLSAVGEQYLDVLPTSDQPPYAEDGDVLVGDEDSLPVGEDELLVDLDELVASLDADDLNTTITELGATFRGTDGALERLVDSGGRFVRLAVDNEQATFDLLENGRTVLATQARNGDSLRFLARDLADLTGTLRAKDRPLRTVLEGGASAVREVDRLLTGLEPTLPVFLADLVTLNQIVTARLPAVEQLLVTFPKLVANGFTGTPGDGYGHINLQLAQFPGPCRDGFKPSSEWRPSTDLTDSPVFPARCEQGPPFNMRGSKYAPEFDDGGASSRPAPFDLSGVAGYDPATGAVDGPDGPGSAPAFTLGSTGGLSTIFGDDSWRWMLIGPQAGS